MEIENKYVTDPTEIINFLNNLNKNQANNQIKKLNDHLRKAHQQLRNYEKIIFKQELEIQKLKLKLT